MRIPRLSQRRSGLSRRALVLLGVLVAGAAGADSFDDAHSRLGPAREVAVLGFPLELLSLALRSEPMLGVEVRVMLDENWAIAVQPVGVWYVAGGVTEEHGGGVGAFVSGLYFLERPLAGGFVGLQAGDIEALVDGETGRTVGGAALFGYSLSWEDGFQASVALGFGYWYRMGVVSAGVALPEIMSLRLGLGYAW